MTQYNEWEIWNGGECPVEPGTMGQVQFDNESRISAASTEPKDLADHRCQCWDYTTDRGVIIAYRTVNVPVVKVVSGFAHSRSLMKTYPIRITVTDGKVTAVELAE